MRPRVIRPVLGLLAGVLPDANCGMPKISMIHHIRRPRGAFATEPCGQSLASPVPAHGPRRGVRLRTRAGNAWVRYTFVWKRRGNSSVSSALARQDLCLALLSLAEGGHTLVQSIAVLSRNVSNTYCQMWYQRGTRYLVSVFGLDVKYRSSAN